ncbi:PEP-CTERM/exosortase system-associated acyltransferase [Alteromonas gracilis]|uniref:PEP-CTERM/exosortase system-associated acyltransferase n=1 Tax=Alteromonas gracilis TaxID=1479524 RepID=UPI003734CA6B
MQSITNQRSTSPFNQVVSGTKRALSLYRTINSAKHLFLPVIATSPTKREACFSIRYNVFAEELNLEPLNDCNLEFNESDHYSTHCLLSLKHSNDYCGTVRLVSPVTDVQLLPIEESCLHSITDMRYHPNCFRREDICEVSRLAIPSQFRARNVDKFLGAGLGNIKSKSTIKKASRAFPLIAVCLYLAAAAIAVNSGRKHVYVMIEPALARKMSVVGLAFKQIGTEIDYHGKRAPFYIHADDAVKSIKLPFKLLFNSYLAKLR